MKVVGNSLTNKADGETGVHSRAALWRYNDVVVGGIPIHKPK
jgi:hypothetical protein